MSLTPLLDRELESSSLEQSWKLARQGRPQLVLLWGRRRVGKTFLLSHFLQGKRGFLFGSTQQSEATELGRLHDVVRRELGEDVAALSGGGYRGWEAALASHAALAAKEPLVVALDEVPYLTQSTPGFASIVQTIWDHLRPNTKLMLILTGSAVSTVESMMAAGAPLRGRPTLKLRLDPLDAPAARRFLPNLSAEHFVEAYAACGGYPLHLLSWDSAASTDENLLRLAGSPGGILLEDAGSMLREELPNVAGYPRILAAIGRGLTRYSDIKSAAGQRIDRPLEVLMDAGFIQKALPLGAPKGARPDYEVTDAYLLFWFSVLYSDRGLIEGGQGTAVMLRAKPRYQTHIGHVFEQIARCHARRLVGRGELPEDLVVGRWWASSGEPCEIDVLGLRGKRTYLMGEAKWQAKPVGMNELERLRRKVHRVPKPVDNPSYALWTRAGATKQVRTTEASVFDVAAMLD